MIFINNGKLIIPRGISPSFSKYGDSKLEHKKIAYTENGTYKISPGDNFDGILDVDVSVNVKYKSQDGQKFGYSADFDYSNIEFEPRTGLNCDNMFIKSGITYAPYFDTSGCTSMTSMFEDTYSLLEIPKYDISNVSDFSYMFKNSAITSLPWNEINIAVSEEGETYIDEMFNNSNITSVPLIKYNIDGINYSGSSFANMFNNCTSLTTLAENQEFYLGNEDDGNIYYGSLSSMFSGTKINKVPKFGYTIGVNDFSYMFNNCSELSDVTNFNTFDFTSAESSAFMFFNCAKLTGDIHIPNPNEQTTSLTNTAKMFSGCKLISSFKFDFGYDVSIDDMSQMFYECSKLTNVDLSENMILDESSDTNCMFKGCMNLNTIIAGNGDYLFNTNNATEMFYHCVHLGNENIAIITDEAIACRQMFYNCAYIKNVNLTSLKKCTDASKMFYKCYNLETFTLDSPQTNLPKIDEMFRECRSIKSIGDIYLTNEAVDIGNSTPVSRLFFDGGNELTSVGTIRVGDNIKYSETTVAEPFYISKPGSKYNFYKLTDFGGIENYGGYLDLHQLKNLSKQSMLNVINKLKRPQHTAAITFSSNLKNVLSADEIKIATDKGYRIFYKDSY